MKIKIWPLFFAIAIQFVLVVGVQILVSQFFLEKSLGAGLDHEAAKLEMKTAMANPQVFTLNKVIPHMLSGFVILVFAYLNFSKIQCSLRDRLGLVWPKISFVSIAVLVFGSLFVSLIGASIADIVDGFFNSEPLSLESRRPLVFQYIDNFWGVVLITVIAFFPGFFEELAYRGFLQRGLMTRFSPIYSIFIVSVIFGIVHIEPRSITLSTIMGVWLGIIAWKTNSIWITVICHAFINGLFMFYQVGVQLWGFPVSLELKIKVIVIIALIPAFIGALKILKDSSDGIHSNYVKEYG